MRNRNFPFKIKLDNIFCDQPQFSSFEINTTHYAKEIGILNERVDNFNSTSLRDLDSNHPKSEKTISLEAASFKYIYCSPD